MARGALVRLQARDGSRTSDNEPSLACRASASITGCVRKSLLRLRPSAYLTRDHRLVAATTLRLKTKMQAAKTSTVSPRVAPSGAGARRRMFVAPFGEKLGSSRALHTPFASRCFVGGIPPPRLVRAWCRITRTGVSPFPCAWSLHASPCPDLP